jgi:GNAT superfamily N-acetyltransferase
VQSCPEISLGIFQLHEDDTEEGSLLAMILGTRIDSPLVTEESMALGGHLPSGETVALHSLCVHPAWRAKGLGTRIMREYIERVGRIDGIKRIALLAHDELGPFYER